MAQPRPPTREDIPELNADRSPLTVRGLQERAARALPAAEVEVVDGWWLRRAPGCAWWVQTVLPHGDAETDEVLRRVARAETCYADRGVEVRFQITPGVCPREHDGILAGVDMAEPRDVAGGLDETGAERTTRQLVHGSLGRLPDKCVVYAWTAVQCDGSDAVAEWACSNASPPRPDMRVVLPALRREQRLQRSMWIPLPKCGLSFDPPTPARLRSTVERDRLSVRTSRCSATT